MRDMANGHAQAEAPARALSGGIVEDGWRRAAFQLDCLRIAECLNISRA